MKTLWLMRHGEAMHAQPGSKDYERVLTLVGEAQAKKIGQRLHQKQVTFDRILASHAQRAVLTTTLVTRALFLPSDVINLEPRIYNASVDTLEALIAEQADSINTLFICGHNPGISVLASILASDDFLDFAPATLCQIELAIDSWSKLKNKCGKIITLEVP